MKYVLVSRWHLCLFVLSCCMLNNAITEKNALNTLFCLALVFFNCFVCFDKEV